MQHHFDASLSLSLSASVETRILGKATGSIFKMAILSFRNANNPMKSALPVSRTRQPLFSRLSANDKRDWLCFLIGLGTFILFLPALWFEFLFYDDAGYVFNNSHVASGIGVENLFWALKSLNADVSYWHPLTWFSHQLDCQLFGLSSGAHHLTSVFLHSIAGVLLFLFLQRSTGRLGCSAFVAALFCVHPTHVESVAWVSERKDVLTALFWMATLISYHSYSRKRTVARYLLVLLLFVMDLMSKPAAVTLPFVLLLMDYWPLGRFGQPVSDQTIRGSSCASLILEKVPLFILAALASVAAFQAQSQLGAMTSLDALDRSSRLDNTIMAYATYILKTFWPTNLAVIYTRIGAWPFERVVLVGGFLAAISFLAFRLRRSQPYLIVGWLWFLGVLVPMIGLVQVGAQWMADRYTYISTIGLFIMITWGAVDILNRFSIPKSVAPSVAILVICTLAPMTHRQLLCWQTGETVFGHAAAVTTGNWLAEHNFALALANDGKYLEAETHLAKALEIAPRDPTVKKTQGNICLNLGKPGLAVQCYQEVLAVKPDDLEVSRRLAWIYATSEDSELRSGVLAAQLAEKVCDRSKTSDAGQYDVLAAAYAANGEFNKAVTTAQKACTLAQAAGEDFTEIRKRLQLYQAGQPYYSKFEPKRTGQFAASQL